ncbi:MAG: hypothetical protein HW420_1571 [Candidatus Nitrosotenuis sp.]|nr:hypothetical protein [Candidatus Nitrosotenuis sp.]
MLGIDVLLAQYFEHHIDTHLGTAIRRKIKDRLFERYGLSLQQSLRQFDIFEKVLKEFFGDASEGVLKNLFESVCVVKKQKLNKKQKSSFIEVRDETLAKFILESYGDENKKAILLAATDTALTLPEILKKSGLPTSSGYRVFNSLLKDGLISEIMINSEKNQKTKFKTTIKEIKVNLAGAKLEISIFFSTEALKSSRVLATVAPKLTI